jgi:hypothetical protein
VVVVVLVVVVAKADELDEVVVEVVVVVVFVVVVTRKDELDELEEEVEARELEPDDASPGSANRIPARILLSLGVLVVYVAPPFK